MTASIRPLFRFPAAPRVTQGSGISHADDWAWKVAKLAYMHASARHRDPQAQIPWESLSEKSQDTWFWIGKAVMAALDDLE